MHDVFISYSSKNDEYANIICQHLEKEGIKCWYAKRDIVAGESWASAIVEAIKSSRVFVLVFSEQSNLSRQVLREVSLAAEKNCYIVPFRIDDTEMIGDMEYYLQSVHWLDAYSRPVEEATHEMASRIKPLLGIREEEITEKESRPIEIPVNSGDDDIDADEVVEDELENCETLGVNSDFEPSPEKEEIEEMIESDDEDDLYEKANNRYQKFMDWTILIAGVLSILLLLWEYAYPSVSKWIDKDKMQFVKISQYGDYKYPFYSTSMFIDGLDMMFTKDTKTNKLALVKTETGYPLITDIDYEFEEDYFTRCYTQDDSDIVYLWDTVKKRVKIYDRGKNKWINSKGVDIKLASTEYITDAFHNISSLNISKKDKDNIIFLIHNYKGEARCYSKIINFKSDGTFDVIDISQHKLVSYIGVASGGSVLMWTDDEQLRILKIKDGSLPELTHKEIVEKYVHSVNAPNDVISPDKRFLCRQKKTEDAVNVVVWELEGGTKVFSSSFAKKSSVYFSNNNKLLCYNRENSKLIEYSLEEEGKQRVIFDKQYFIDNKEFIEYPHSFFYSSKLNMCFFSSLQKAGKNKYKDKLVMTDLKGKIIGQSEEFEIPGDSGYPEVVVKDNKIFYMYNMSVPNKTFDDGTYSMIYRTMYSIDKKGNVIFE